MRVSIPLDLYTRPVLPLPRFIRSRHWDPMSPTSGRDTSCVETLPNRDFHARGVPARRGRHGVPVAAPPKPGKKTVSVVPPVPANAGGPRKRLPRAQIAIGKRPGQTWAVWGPSGGTAETGKKNGIGGPPGASKCRGPPETADPSANRDWGAFPRVRRPGQTWAAWGPSGGTAETGKKNGSTLLSNSGLVMFCSDRFF
jgi:hypothetical protein